MSLLIIERICAIIDKTSKRIIEGQGCIFTLCHFNMVA